MASSDDTFSVDAFLGLPRLSGLAVSPQGDRLVTSVAERDKDGKRYRSSLHALDPRGSDGPRRLTRSGKGEGAPAFLPDGTLLFSSARPDPDRGADAKDEHEDTPALWRLPGEGEAELVAAPPGGVTGVSVAREAGAIVVATPLHPGSESWEDDRERERARKDAGVTAQLLDVYPIRFWDRWFGPRQLRLFAAASAEAAAEEKEWADLTPDPGHLFEFGQFCLSPDGATVVATRWREEPDPRDRAVELIAIDVGGGTAEEPTVIARADRVAFRGPACSPDGAWVACVRWPLGAPDEPPDMTLALLPIDGSSAPRDLLPGFDGWPQDPVWAPDGSALYFTADDDGHRLPFRVRLADGEVSRLADWGYYEELTPAPDGTEVYALRSGIGAPARVVALDCEATDAEPRLIASPGDGIEGPGNVERVETTAADGTRVPGWLVSPPDADGPAPLAVFIHGGPLSSWNHWQWRWNPHVLAARGWAVLLPDPALSTGYGLDYIRRGWGRWGAEPYTDLLALVDHVEARDDIDADRTAALGGSFGGYMANWVAGHTDRFDAIVTHASLWNLEAFHGTTDMGPWWENQMGDRYQSPEAFREWSPHRFVDRISTPMLVIHGERDFRVPVSEGLTLWTDLRRHGAEAHYLHFPDEHHWVLKPQHAALWYETVLAFIEHHALGEPWDPPDVLR